MLLCTQRPDGIGKYTADDHYTQLNNNLTEFRKDHPRPRFNAFNADNEETMLSLRAKFHYYYKLPAPGDTIHGLSKHIC